MNTDLVVVICEIILVLCGAGIAWGIYLWYLGCIWGWQDHEYLRKPIHMPVSRVEARWTVVDRDGREISTLE